MDYQIQYNCRITDKGTLVIQGSEQFFKELKKRKGMQGSLIINFYDCRDTKSLIGHYKFHILPKFQEAYRSIGEMVHIEDVEERLWNMSTVTKGCSVCNVWKLEANVLYLYIEDLKRIAAEDFGVYIH